MFWLLQEDSWRYQDGQAVSEDFQAAGAEEGLLACQILIHYTCQKDSFLHSVPKKIFERFN